MKPGVISGGNVTHDCPLSRSVGYFLEPLVMLAPFSKRPMNLTLRGITTDDKDLSVDLIRTVTLPHLQLFGISEGLELRVRMTSALKSLSAHASCSLDKEARCDPSWWWRSAISLSDCEAGKNFELCGARQDKTDKRHCVSSQSQIYRLDALIPFD